MKYSEPTKSIILILLFIFVISYSYVPLRGIVTARSLDLIGYSYHHMKPFRFFFMISSELSALITSFVIGGVVALPFGAIFQKRTILCSLIVSIISSLWIVEKMLTWPMEPAFERDFGVEHSPEQYLQLLADYRIDFLLFILVFTLCCSIGNRVYQHLTIGGRWSAR